MSRRRRADLATGEQLVCSHGGAETSSAPTPERVTIPNVGEQLVCSPQRTETSSAPTPETVANPDVGEHIVCFLRRPPHRVAAAAVALTLIVSSPFATTAMAQTSDAPATPDAPKEPELLPPPSDSGFATQTVSDDFALTLVLAGIVMAVSQVASVAGRLAWGVLADRALSRRTMLGLLGLGMGASAIATLASGPGWPAWLLFLFAAVFGATAVGWNGVYIAELARIAPAGRVSEATGGCLFFTFLGVVVTPLLFNLVLQLGGGYSLAYALLGVPGLAVGASLLLRRPGRTAERAG